MNDTEDPDCIHIDTEHKSKWNLPLCKCEKVKNVDCWHSRFGAPDCDFYEEKR